ncbi:MAG: hypothetical protein M1818_004428 [Claussenomyces sp. TS43310]|nr:MAG: hypothetical protein M1818_004428 [Claussenomyces sp. TS43310]
MAYSIPASKGSPCGTAPPRSGKQTLNDNRDPFDERSGERFDVNGEQRWWNDERSSASRQETDATTRSRMTQWPATKEIFNERVVKSPHISTQLNSRKRMNRYSVQKPTKARQQQQNAKAGIKVITNFSRHQGPAQEMQRPIVQPETPQLSPQAGTFVNLAALQALDRRAPSNNTGFWKSMREMLPNRPEVISDAAELHSQDAPNVTNTNEPNSILCNQRSKGSVPLRLENELSPGDRPIVIGLSIPSISRNKSPENADSNTSDTLQTYQDQNSGLEPPETPTIIITPAQTSSEDRTLNVTSSSGPRPTSSVYSRTTDSWEAPSLTGIASMHQIYESTLQSRGEDVPIKHGIRHSTDTLFDEDVTPQSASRPRIMSSSTVFEEDTTPILPKPTQIPARNPIKHTSLRITTDLHQSSGWWNYILTPFLARSNTLVSPRSAPAKDRPDLPNIEAAKGGDDSSQYHQEKAFSPVTPQTSTTIASDAWWDKRNTLDGLAKQPAVDNTISPGTSDEQSGTLPFMLLPSASVLNRNRMAAIERAGIGTDPSHPGQILQRDASTRTGLSASDRDAPVVLDIASLNAFDTMTHGTVGERLVEISDRSARSRQQLPNTNAVRAPNGGVTALMSHESEGRDDFQPPPYSPPRAYVPRYRAVFPPGHLANLQEPSSPGPQSPGLQQAMSSRGAIALTDVSLTPAPRRPINLNSGYPTRQEHNFPPPPTTKSLKAEKRRHRYEKEDAAAQKVSGLWRGRSCKSDRGCYGRSGVEGRKRRRWYCGLITGSLCLIILIVVLATQLHHKSKDPVRPSQWVNLTGFPPMFTGLSTVVGPENSVAHTGCVFPATMWSCDLPKELQQSGSQPNQPNFRLQIQWDNSTEANATFANVTGNPKLPVRSASGNAVSAGHFIRILMRMTRRALTFSPSPSPPSYAEQFFLGNTTDGVVSDSKAGEPTPFYISLLSTTSGSGSSAAILKRDSNTTDPFPNVTAFIPAASVNADGTAAPANLLPLPSQQPIRLYDRGLETEHYGIYTYFDRSIFLKSTALLNESQTADGEVPDDENGGSTEAAALFRCTWAQTRLLVQIWTRRADTSALLDAAGQSGFLDSASNYTAAVANDFSRPGSFPYPVTITTDRHGGDVTEKLIYCYELDAREKPIAGSGKVWSENRQFGGVGINPAPNVFGNQSDPSLGGYDGGTGGCSCVWDNWQTVTHT